MLVHQTIHIRVYKLIQTYKIFRIKALNLTNNTLYLLKVLFLKVKYYTLVNHSASVPP